MSHQHDKALSSVWYSIYCKQIKDRIKKKILKRVCNILSRRTYIIDIVVRFFKMLCLFRGFPGGSGASLIAQLVKNPPAMQETLVRLLGQEDPLEKG